MHIKKYCLHNNTWLCVWYATKYSMVRTLSKNLNLFLAWSHMDFWKQTQINCHYILTIILHLISLSQNIATFLLKNEYFLELSIGNTTVATSGAIIAYHHPRNTWVHFRFCSGLTLTPISFLFSVVVNCVCPCLFLSLMS